VEVTALKPNAASGLRGASPLLRLQPDERLIALTRRGQHAAFETLFSRYHTRLLSFCRHMLGSREDAEDVLQEVFAAAFNAVLADERPINVRPWLYRIARNRSLNHLRRASAIGVDSMDIHFSENGLSTGDQVLRRESFRQLIGDVQQLPETQRTALLLREIDALSYDQIALAMETTVPSVKSLLVRARISLAEAAEARKLSCEDVRAELGEAAEGLTKISPPARRHMRDCERCRTFRKLLKDNNHALAAVFPVGPLLLLKRLVLSKLGASASAGHAAGAGSATAGVGAAGGASSGAGAAGGLLTAGAGASAGAGLASGTSAAGGLMTAGAGAIATKAAATLAAAALVTAVAASHPSHVRHHASPTSSGASVDSATVLPAHSSTPLVVRSVAQPQSTGVNVAAATAAQLTVRRSHRRAAARKQELAGENASGQHTRPLPATSTAPPVTTPTVVPVAKAPVAPPAVVQVTTETTQLPSTTTSTTAATPPPAAEAPASTTTTTTGAAPEATPPVEEPAPGATTPASPAPTGEGETPTAGSEATEIPIPGGEAQLEASGGVPQQ
jgi:RNA polymerase sigma factor (sigma-70 family)